MIPRLVKVTEYNAGKYFNYMLIMHCSLADINECAVNNGTCMETCTNTNGSFFCSCNAGFLLNANAKTCTGK